MFLFWFYLLSSDLMIFNKVYMILELGFVILVTMVVVVVFIVIVLLGIVKGGNSIIIVDFNIIMIRLVIECFYSKFG